ncbi:MAG: hypothetical protein FWC57_04625, partial [Endomicrobia bacterium]|nr:hypothetical protein [Endomicrobiia bacterium]
MSKLDYDAAKQKLETVQREAAAVPAAVSGIDFTTLTQKDTMSIMTAGMDPQILRQFGIGGGSGGTDADKLLPSFGMVAAQNPFQGKRKEENDQALQSLTPLAPVNSVAGFAGDAANWAGSSFSPDTTALSAFNALPKDEQDKVKAGLRDYNSKQRDVEDAQKEFNMASTNLLTATERVNPSFKSASRKALIDHIASNMSADVRNMLIGSFDGHLTQNQSNEEIADSLVNGIQLGDRRIQFANQNAADSYLNQWKTSIITSAASALPQVINKESDPKAVEGISAGIGDFAAASVKGGKPFSPMGVVSDFISAQTNLKYNGFETGAAGVAAALSKPGDIAVIYIAGSDVGRFVSMKVSDDGKINIQDGGRSSAISKKELQNYLTTNNWTRGPILTAKSLDSSTDSFPLDFNTLKGIGRPTQTPASEEPQSGYVTPLADDGINNAHGPNPYGYAPETPFTPQQPAVPVQPQKTPEAPVSAQKTSDQEANKGENKGGVYTPVSPEVKPVSNVEPALNYAQNMNRGNEAIAGSSERVGARHTNNAIGALDNFLTRPIDKGTRVPLQTFDSYGNRTPVSTNATGTVMNTATTVGRLFKSGANAMDGINKLMQENPEFYNISGLIETLNMQYGPEAVQASLLQIQKINNYSSRINYAVGLINDVRNPMGFNFSSSFSNDIPIANIIGLLAEGLRYAQMGNRNAARVKLQSMMNEYFGSLDDRKSKYYSVVEKANVSGRMKTHSGTLSLLDKYQDNAEMAFDHTIFAFIFDSPDLKDALSGNYVISENLRREMIQSYTTGNFTNAEDWERYILSHYSGKILLDAWNQYENGVKTSSAADKIMLLQMIADLPMQLGDFKNRTNMMSSETVGGAIGGQTNMSFTKFIPYYTQLFDKQGFGQAFKSQIQKVAKSYTKREGEKLMAAILNSQNISPDDKALIINAAGQAAPSIMLGDAVFSKYKTTFSKDFSKRLMQANPYNSETSAADWAQKTLADNSSDAGVEALSQKMKQLESDKTGSLKNDGAFYRDMQDIIKDINSKDINLDKLTMYKRGEAVSIIAKASNIIRNHDMNDGKQQADSLRGIIDRYFSGSYSGLKQYMPSSDTELIGALRANNFNSAKTFYNLLAERFFIEPAMSPAGQVVGWSWGLRKTGENLGWGVQPAANAEWANKWNPNDNILTYDKLQEAVKPEILSGYKGAFKMSDPADFGMRFDFVFGQKTSGTVRERLGGMIKNYRETFFKYAIDQERAKGE